MSEVTITPRPDDPLLRRVAEHLAAGGATDVQHLIATIKGREYTVTLSREPINPIGGMPDFRWHISLAGPQDVPPWNVMAAVAHEVRPGVPFCIPVPPRSQWMNYNERVLHLYEIKDNNLTEQWRTEGKGHTPT